MKKVITTGIEVKAGDMITHNTPSGSYETPIYADGIIVSVDQLNELLNE